MRNRLLTALPPDDLDRIDPHLGLVQLRQDETLFGPEGTSRYVYFPDTAVVSLVTWLDQHETIEIGTAGTQA